jgi:hypothetical protein
MGRGVLASCSMVVVMATTAAHRAGVWLAPGQLPFVRRVAEAAGLSFVVAGSSTRGQSMHMAAQLDAAAGDDLRAALATAECELFLIADPGTFGAGGQDASAVGAARARGVRVATIEPIPSTPMELTARGWLEPADGVRPAEAVTFCGSLSRLTPFRDSSALLDAFGPIRAASVEAWAGVDEASTGARLYAAIELVRRLLGEPESIDAGYVGPSRIPGVHSLPGESLRGLHGDVTAHCRFADGRAATVCVSDCAGRWGHGVTLLGPAGRVRVLDGTVEWVGPDGAEHEVPRYRRGRSGGRPSSSATDDVAEAVVRLLASDASDLPIDHAGVLCMCHAALLSCRTGQPESPATIRRMAGAE